MRFKVYDKLHCPKCRMTERKLKDSGATFKTKTLLLPENKDYTDFKLKQFRSKGFRSFPVVRVYDNDGQLVDEWCDLKMDKLKAYLG